MPQLNIKKSISSFIVLVMLLFLLSVPVFAKSEKFEVDGKLYEFTKDSHYEFYDNVSFKSTEPSMTYGIFSVGGNIEKVKTKSVTPSYKVSDGNFVFYYDYKDTKLNAGNDFWHLVDDKSKRVSDVELDSDIMKGTIIIQTYNNHWVTVKTINNAFSDVPNRTDPIYTATDMQLVNGCRYRVIVVYELARKIEDSNFLFINTDKYDYKKYAEVYKFYLFPNNGDSKEDDLEQTYRLGERVKTKEFDGYFGAEEALENDDIHYGWDLGNFFVSGFTGKVKGNDGNMVFLKNVGDTVTLWFKLDQDINCLNGDDKLSIAADKEGYDKYFETDLQNFGRGTLIIRHTDYINVKVDPVIYTDYLDAYASPDADKIVKLCEEGDYEVALDYEVKKAGLIGKNSGHYRIFFKFSVRNGDSMVYLFDVKTGSELMNSYATENGFRLDLAKSRYLNITLKREILTSSSDGLVEDTRFNGVAKDGAEYTDEGIYTITSSNEYTGVSTTKKIYVGTNDILRAHVATGYSIPEINNLIAKGATISKDGSIQQPASIMSDKSDAKTSAQLSPSASSNQNAISSKSNDATVNVMIYVIVAMIITSFVAVAWITKENKKPTESK